MKKTSKALLLVFLCCVFSFIYAVKTKQPLEHESPTGNVYQFSFTTIDGAPMPLSDFNGKVMVIVNTASQCGFTGQYTDLQKIYEEYKTQDFVVIGVPCNQFANQEPDSEETIAKFVLKNYGVTFPLTSKADVKGRNIHPFFEWATAQEKRGVLSPKARWNFHKLIIDRKGRLVSSFASQVNPSSAKMRAEVERLLKDTP